MSYMMMVCSKVDCICDGGSTKTLSSSDIVDILVCVSASYDVYTMTNSSINRPESLPAVQASDMVQFDSQQLHFQPSSLLRRLGKS